MKKMWMIAAVACAALMISCGGEKKATDVKAKAVELANSLVEAVKSGDQAKIDAVNNAGEEYVKSLSEADKKAFEEAAKPILEAAGLM